jgi:Na+/proline symporter
MHFITPTTGYAMLIIFGIAMVAITYFFGRWGNWNTKEAFLVADREVNWLWGGFSIAASWIWAPALFVSVQVAYQMGTAGVFWFVLPNILSLTIFAVLAPKIREKLPAGYTLPGYIRARLQSSRVHRIYLFPYLFYQLMAVVVQLYAGGSLASLLTGIALPKVMIALAIVVLVYTLISGLKASIVTDFIQLGMILVIAAVILPWAIHAAGGFGALKAGLAGSSQVHGVFDKGVAFTFGVVTSIGLIAGSLSDQSNWQRAFAIRKTHLVKAFVFGSLLFGIVPLALSTLGFLAANPALHITLPAGVDVSMVGVQVISKFLPSWVIMIFAVGLLAILSSAFDAGLCAASSLWATDVFHPKTNEESVKVARYSMVGMTALGLLISLGILYIPHFGLQQLWWVFNTIAACVMAPTILSLYKNKLSERGVFWGVLCAFVLGIPFFVYGNIINNSLWIVGSSIGIVIISGVISMTVRRKFEEANDTQY